MLDHDLIKEALEQEQASDLLSGSESFTPYVTFGKSSELTPVIETERVGV